MLLEKRIFNMTTIKQIIKILKKEAHYKENWKETGSILLFLNKVDQKKVEGRLLKEYQDSMDIGIISKLAQSIAAIEQMNFGFYDLESYFSYLCDKNLFVTPAQFKHEQETNS